AEDRPMSHEYLDELRQGLAEIDRPGSFCVSGTAPVVLPGLEVAGLGPVGLPLTARQANELKKHCDQAPYGKGEETLVDTSVRRVWRLTPDRFTLTNPDWEPFLRQTVRKGHRLCLVYNLTLARSKKALAAPRYTEPVERIRQALRRWADADAPRKLVVTLEHQYTQEGLAWDALKGVDRARARALRDAA